MAAQMRRHDTATRGKNQRGTLVFPFLYRFLYFFNHKKMASQLEDMIQQLAATHEQQLAATPNVLHLFFLFPYTFRIFIKYNKWLYKCEDMMQQQQQLTNSNVVYLFFLFHIFSVFFKIQHWLHKCEDMMPQLAATHEQQLAANTNVVHFFFFPYFPCFYYVQ